MRRFKGEVDSTDHHENDECDDEDPEQNDLGVVGDVESRTGRVHVREGEVNLLHPGERRLDVAGHSVLRYVVIFKKVCWSMMLLLRLLRVWKGLQHFRLANLGVQIGLEDVASHLEKLQMRRTCKEDHSKALVAARRGDSWLYSLRGTTSGKLWARRYFCGRRRSFSPSVVQHTLLEMFSLEHNFELSR